MSLDALERELRRDLELLSYPRREWLAARTTRGGVPILDVLVVGAGQGGLACAAALLRERVDNILVVDDHPLDRAGPWLNFARMITLRTPKHLTGPDLGIPNLTIQRWYEAQHGDGSWERLGLVPKETWADYLAWYRRVLAIPVRAETTVELVDEAPGEGCLVADVVQHGRRDRIFARRIVLATGIDGSGAWDVPAAIREAIPRAQWAHTRDDIDFAALRGKRVGVLGAGASAFDNAAVALEHGAAKVELFFRRKRLVDVNAYRWAEFVGFLKHMGDVPDAEKWKFVRQILRMGQLPPADTLRRASEHPSFVLRPESPWQRIDMRGDTIVVTAPSGEHELDFVIVGTGFVTDLSRRPELAKLAPHAALWRDRYTPPAADAHDDLARHPYLGPSFEYVETHPGRAPWIGHVYNYTFGGLASLGFGGASISGMKYSVQRLVAGLTRSLFCEDCEQHLASLCSWDEKEF
ncbi:MAG TPA: NAD(P)/FAD-dependent oxidoreductase [Nannocystaceae bacterium]|nr:NAD(P)/FAD-dependent oxidoreductase [Nannocystaceae bacterium]